MAKQKENLKGMKREELEKELADLRENMRSIRFKSEGSKPKNVKEYGALRKRGARILTELNSK